MTDTFIHDSRMTGDSFSIIKRILIRDVFASTVLALVFAILGVYDTDTMPFWSNFGFWLTTMIAGAIACGLAEPFVFGRLMRDQHPMLQLFTIAALISVPITLALMGVQTDFNFQSSPINWCLQYFNVLIIAIVIVTGRYVAPQVFARVNPPSSASDEAESPVARFLGRLPLKYRAAMLHAVSSEGHYLRVYTDKGEPLILMRLSDAVLELSGAMGLQVHRSWWVAHDGVAETISRNGRRILILKSGTKVPVSRSHLQAIKDAGLE